MLTPYRNPYTGLLSAGYRFRFQIRAISHHTLFLPLEMKNLTPIQDLLKGVSPLEVFNTPDLKSARKAFVDRADVRRAFFNTYRTPDALRGIDFAYVHFANMSLWHDPDGDKSARAFSAASGGVLLSHRTLNPPRSPPLRPQSRHLQGPRPPLPPITIEIVYEGSKHRPDASHVA